MDQQWKCDVCGKNLSSYHSLWRHKKTVHLKMKTAAAAAVKDIPTFNGSDFLSGNPSKETMKKLKDHIKSQTINHVIDSMGGINRLPTNTNKDSSGQDHIDMEIDRTPTTTTTNSSADRVPNQKWTKNGKITTDSDNLVTVFLPATPLKLRERFDKLFFEFARDGRLDNRNELVCLLDEMKRQESIPEDDYIKFNIFLSKSLPHSRGGSGIGDSSDETGGGGKDMEVDDFKQMVRSSTKYIVKNDHRELEKLNNEYGEADAELVTLIRDYLGEKIPMQNVLDYLDGGHPDSHQIPKSIQIRYRILVKDIEANRLRVREIMERVNAVLHDEHQLTAALESLRREELISSDQYERLLDISGAAAAVLELKTIADIIRDTTV